MKSILVGITLLILRTLPQDSAIPEKAPRSLAWLKVEFDDYNWVVRQNAFHEYQKLADLQTPDTRTTIFNLLLREHAQLETWLTRGKTVPEAWGDPYYPSILGVIQENYFSDLKESEFQVLSRATMNPESEFLRELARRAGSNLAWLAANVAAEENEHVRVNMRSLALQWMKQYPDASPPQRLIVLQMLKDGANDKSEFARSYSQRALKELEPKVVK